MFINLVNSFWKNSRTVPTGPFLCLGECKIVCVKGLYKSTSVLAY